MNWNLIISGLVTVVIKAAGMTLFLLHFPQVFYESNDGFIPTESYGTTNVQNGAPCASDANECQQRTPYLRELQVQVVCTSLYVGAGNCATSVAASSLFLQLSIFGRNNDSVMPTRSYGTACPKDWDFHRGRCFFFSTSEASWENSRGDCVSRGSTLAIADTAEKLKYLQDIAGAEKYFVALRRQSGERKWRWINNSVFSGNVTNENQNFHCVTIGLTKTFDAASCDISYRWICEKSPK